VIDLLVASVRLRNWPEPAPSDHPIVAKGMVPNGARGGRMGSSGLQRPDA
jgi:hypothetical protein